MAGESVPQSEDHANGGAAGSRGLVLAVAAYGLWGLFPFYFQLVKAAGAVEVIGHRILWSFVFCFAGVLLWRQWRHLVEVVRNRRLFWGLAAAGVLVSLNWLVYVWAVLNDHIVDAALGYFVNPLVTVALAVVFLRERLRPAQKVAVGVGLVAVIVIAVGYGQVPWVALALALSFGLYGLVKNRVGGKVSPLVGLTVETSVLSPVALVYLGWLQVTGAGTLLGHGVPHTAALLGAGAVTAVPLLLFAGAASRIPLSMLGFIQYLTPILQFSIGVWVNHEVMPLPRWIGFGLVWVALVILTVDGLRPARSRAVVVDPEIQS
ncbi:EamA family transporter RarD [Propionicicella superfundia]|uniref:EamA family transporter RarD n=1 Tax=Propionicicella superfundia TaxID=348582 RepID=UPI0004246207|nr:EamA family transporter RarD [Propionicicella superfundia]